MFEVAYETTFNATHCLTASGVPLEPPHGHDFRVEVAVGAETLGSSGMVIDFDVLKAALTAITSRLHYTDLNEHPAFREGSPSAEALARYVFEEMSGALGEGAHLLRRVCIFEAPGCSATYSE